MNVYLWAAIESILKKYKNDVQIIIYTGDTDATPDEILHRVKQRFDMNMQVYKPSITFIYLRTRFFVEAKYYKMFTLIRTKYWFNHFRFRSFNTFCT